MRSLAGAVPLLPLAPLLPLVPLAPLAADRASRSWLQVAVAAMGPACRQNTPSAETWPQMPD